MTLMEYIRIYLDYVYPRLNIKESVKDKLIVQAREELSDEYRNRIGRERECINYGKGPRQNSASEIRPRG